MMADGPGHIMLIEGRFYEDIVDQLVGGAIAELSDRGASYERFAVPGALEIPAAIAYAVRSMDFYTARQRFDGYVALGCVIRGETSHYDIVAGESARALEDLALRHCLAVGNGILTCDTRDQAWGRAAVDQRNKGGQAASACLQMIAVKHKLHLYPR